MTLKSFKQLIDELYETNDYGYDGFDVDVQLAPDKEEPSVLRIDLFNKTIEIK